MTKEESKKLEAAIIEQVQMMFAQIREQVPDKDAIRKRMNALEKQIRSTTAIAVELRDKEPEEDTGMFSKKLLGQNNCASCDKNIVNLLNNPGDHQNWNRLPFREPNERIARYGQGFSKILSTMKPSESAAHIRGANDSNMQMDESGFMSHDPTEAMTGNVRFQERSGSVQHEDDITPHKNVIGALHDHKSANASLMSPSSGYRNTINYSTMMGDPEAQTDMTKVQQYKSAAKIRMKKKGSVGQSPNPMKPMVNTTWDAAPDSLPNLYAKKQSHLTNKFH